MMFLIISRHLHDETPKDIDYLDEKRQMQLRVQSHRLHILTTQLLSLALIRWLAMTRPTRLVR